MTELIVPRRFCGPPSSGNGGWTAGALAGLVGRDSVRAGVEGWPAIEVSLRLPPPLDTAMAVTTTDGVTVAASGGATVADARAVETTLHTVDPVDAETARAAEASYPGLGFSPFPTCFVCGTERADGDGLRIFPGPVAPAADGATRVAATWTPHESVAEEDRRRTSLAVAWAALDCVSAWSADFEERPMVLGRMTAQVDTLPVVGEQHVVVGQVLGVAGRKTSTAATLYDPEGRVVARAEHLWIAINPKDFA